MASGLGPLVQIDPTLSVDANGDFYATGAQISPGVVVIAWTNGDQSGTEVFEARAVRWNSDFATELGPLFSGPPVPPDDGGFSYQARLTHVARIADDMAFVVVGDSATEYKTIGWRIHVDPASLVISFVDTMYWSDDVTNKGFGYVVPGPSRTGVSTNLQQYTGGAITAGFISFDDSGSVAAIQTYTSDLMLNCCGIVDRGDDFVIFAKMDEDYVPAVGTTFTLCYQPAYYKLSAWVVPSVGGCPGPTGTKVMIFDEGPIDFDGVYPVLMDNSHIHVLVDVQSMYLYSGDPNTSHGQILDINPNNWTYLKSPQLPYVGNGNSGGLQDYENLQQMNGALNMSMYGMFGLSSDGFRVGIYDGNRQLITQEMLVVSWDTALSRYSTEVHSVGAGGFLAVLNIDGAPDVYAGVYVVSGSLMQTGAIDGAQDISRSAFW